MNKDNYLFIGLGGWVRKTTMYLDVKPNIFKEMVRMEKSQFHERRLDMTSGSRFIIHRFGIIVESAPFVSRAPIKIISFIMENPLVSKHQFISPFSADDGPNWYFIPKATDDVAKKKIRPINVILCPSSTVGRWQTKLDKMINHTIWDGEMPVSNVMLFTKKPETEIHLVSFPNARRFLKFLGADAVTRLFIDHAHIGTWADGICNAFGILAPVASFTWFLFPFWRTTLGSCLELPVSLPFDESGVVINPLETFSESPMTKVEFDQISVCIQRVVLFDHVFVNRTNVAICRLVSENAGGDLCHCEYCLRETKIERGEIDVESCWLHRRSERILNHIQEESGSCSICYSETLRWSTKCRSSKFETMSFLCDTCGNTICSSCFSKWNLSQWSLSEKNLEVGMVRIGEVDEEDLVDEINRFHTPNETPDFEDLVSEMNRSCTICRERWKPKAQPPRYLCMGEPGLGSLSDSLVTHFEKRMEHKRKTRVSQIDITDKALVILNSPSVTTDQICELLNSRKIPTIALKPMIDSGLVHQKHAVGPNQVFVIPITHTRDLLFCELYFNEAVIISSVSEDLGIVDQIDLSRITMRDPSVDPNDGEVFEIHVLNIIESFLK